MSSTQISPGNYPKVGDFYYHYKHFTQNPNQDVLFHCYKIIGIAGDAHNDNYTTKFVIYKPISDMSFLNKNNITCYSRPIEEFLEEANLPEYDYKGKRFSQILDPQIIEKLKQI